MVNELKAPYVNHPFHFAEVYVDATLEAAHYLPHVRFGHKCARVHGHSYRVRMRAAGHVSTDVERGNLGMVVDYDDVLARWQELHVVLDHHMLNEIEGLENPTSENLARWILERLPEYVTSVEIGETPYAGCIVKREHLDDPEAP